MILTSVTLSQLIAVALGGAVGACARFMIAVIFPFVPGQWPMATFVANIMGCLLMGVSFALISNASLPPSVKPWLMTGFLGALTTFSTLALEAWLMLAHNAHLLAMAYLLTSLIVGILAIALGHYLVSLF